MSAEEYAGPKEMIEYYLGMGSYEPIAELIKDPNPKIQLRVLEILAEKAPDLAEGTAEELIDNEDADPDVKDAARKILGRAAEAQETMHSRWTLEMTELWEEVERQLRMLRINTKMIIRWKAKNAERQKELKRMKKEAAEVILPHVNLGHKLNENAYSCVALLLSSRGVEEKLKSDILLYLPKMVRVSTQRQKDILFSATCFLAEKGGRMGASETLVRTALLAMGAMLKEMKQIHQSMGELPEKDKIFHKPANPFIRQELAKAKLKVM